MQETPARNSPTHCRKPGIARGTPVAVPRTEGTRDRSEGGVVNLDTTYLGLKLAHPFIVGASPLADHLDTVKRLEDGGTAAIVLRSLFEEQLTMDASASIHHMDPLDPEF